MSQPQASRERRPPRSFSRASFALLLALALAGIACGAEPPPDDAPPDLEACVFDLGLSMRVPFGGHAGYDIIDHTATWVPNLLPPDARPRICAGTAVPCGATVHYAPDTWPAYTTRLRFDATGSVVEERRQQDGFEPFAPWEWTYGGDGRVSRFAQYRRAGPGEPPDLERLLDYVWGEDGRLRVQAQETRYEESHLVETYVVEQGRAQRSAELDRNCERRELFGYDERGRVTLYLRAFNACTYEGGVYWEATDPHVERFEHDEAGRLLRLDVKAEERVDLDWHHGFTATLSYDEQGRVGELDMDLKGNARYRAAASYDEDGRLLSLDAHNYTATFDYACSP